MYHLSISWLSYMLPQHASKKVKELNIKEFSNDVATPYHNDHHAYEQNILVGA